MIKLLTRCRRLMLVCTLLVLSGGLSFAQQTLTDLSSIDGLDITPDNMFNFQVQLLDASPADVVIKGIIHYRNSDLRIEYSFRTRLQPGINSFNRDNVSPQFQFSSGALRELFMTHKVLPYGTYQYCVIISLPSGEGLDGGKGDCLYRKSEDQFMITLIDPENNAKLYEYNPQLSWVATYSFSSELTYRLRVAEIKDGQNTANALARNNPVYEEKHLMQNSITYPVYAKPLKAWQPYAWTVDAYYKGILLGGAAPWKFMIVEDSTLAEVPRQQSYYEFATHEGDTRLYAVGELKLKYVSDIAGNQLTLVLKNSEQEEIVLPEKTIRLQGGDNRIIIPLSDRAHVKHKKKYNLYITTKDNKSYVVPFTYINPLYLK